MPQIVLVRIQFHGRTLTSDLHTVCHLRKGMFFRNVSFLQYHTLSIYTVLSEYVGFQPILYMFSVLLMQTACLKH